MGYGDLQLNHGYSNVFLVFYIVFSTILLAYGFNNLQNLKDEQEKLRKAHEFTRKKQTLSKIKDLDKGNGVPQDTFVLAVLEHLGVIDHDKDVEPWIKVCNIFVVIAVIIVIAHILIYSSAIQLQLLIIPGNLLTGISSTLTTSPCLCFCMSGLQSISWYY